MKTSRQAVGLLLGSGVLLCGCSSAGGGAGGEGRAGPTLSARTASTAQHEGERGPAEPREGQAYPFDVYTHCGIKWVQFGGRWWVLDTAFPDAERVGGGRGDPRSEWIAGYMTLVGPGAAHFDAAGLPTLRFVPATQSPPGCD